jgi:hypothetical protein
MTVSLDCFVDVLELAVLYGIRWLLDTLAACLFIFFWCIFGAALEETGRAGDKVGAVMCIGDCVGMVGDRGLVDGENELTGLGSTNPRVRHDPGILDTIPSLEQLSA